MHDYSIDGHPKDKVLFVLAFIAITLAPHINELTSEVLKLLPTDLGWVEAPLAAVPVFGLFTLIFWFFNSKLWKLSWARKLLLVPDLNGTWICDGTTTSKNSVKQSLDWKGELSISQSWSKILIHLRTSDSESKSLAASVFHEPGVGYRLVYQFNNSPNADKLDLSKHSGTVELLFSEECDKASGHYFTDQHRSTVGTLNIRRGSK